MRQDVLLSFLVVTDNEGQPPEYVSVTFPEGGLGYVDELVGDYHIVATDYTLNDEQIQL